jgi:hypothetical protein
MVFFLSHDKSPVTPATVEAQTISGARPETQYVDVPDVVVPVQSKGNYEYIQITGSCDSYRETVCASSYAGPGVEYGKRYELENGMILKITSKETRNGQIWYRIHFDEQLRHPERVAGDWYIPAVLGRVIRDDGDQVLTEQSPMTSKRIIIDLSDQTLYAYDGDKEFFVTKVSTGEEHSPTPTGLFKVYKKTPSRYMQGPLEGVTDVPFDLPGVPWNLYFTEDGAVIHGTYWHNRYGTEQSSGCVNLPPELAKLLYDWADVGTVVVVQK